MSSKSDDVIVYYGNGSQTKFEVPGSLYKTVYVNGVLTTPVSQDVQSVTLGVAPGNKVPVEIEYSSEARETLVPAQLSVDASGNVAGILGAGGSVLSLGMGSEFLNFSSRRLRKWQKALARARNGGLPAKIACVGDSTTYGEGSSNNGRVNARAKSYPSVLADLLSKSLLQAQANSWWGDGGTTSLPSSDPRLVINAAWTTDINNSTVGGATLKASTAGALSFTPSKPVKYFDIWHLVNTSLGVMSADIDGGTATTINTNGAVAIRKTTITAATSGMHTCNLTWSSGGSAYVIGMEARDDTDIISVCNMGRMSWKAGDWAYPSTNPWSPLNTLVTMAPDLSIIDLTINDANQGTDLTTYQTNLQTVISRALAVGDVILKIGLPSDPATISQGKQDAIWSINRSLAISNGVPLIDIPSRWGNYDSSLMYNSLHANGDGYADIAATVYRAVNAA